MLTGGAVWTPLFDDESENAGGDGEDSEKLGGAWLVSGAANPPILLSNDDPSTLLALSPSAGVDFDVCSVNGFTCGDEAVLEALLGAEENENP